MFSDSRPAAATPRTPAIELPARLSRPPGRASRRQPRITDSSFAFSDSHVDNQPTGRLPIDADMMAADAPPRIFCISPPIWRRRIDDSFIAEATPFTDCYFRRPRLRSQTDEYAGPTYCRTEQIAQPPRNSAETGFHETASSSAIYRHAQGIRFIYFISIRCFSSHFAILILHELFTPAYRFRHQRHAEFTSLHCQTVDLFFRSSLPAAT